jgi:hypothetical protein
MTSPERKVEDEELEMRSIPNPPRPRLLWVGGGMAAMVMGALLVVSITLAAIGLLMMAVGLAMMASAFLSENGRGMRRQREEEENDDEVVEKEREIGIGTGAEMPREAGRVGAAGMALTREGRGLVGPAASDDDDRAFREAVKASLRR